MPLNRHGRAVFGAIGGQPLPPGGEPHDEHFDMACAPHAGRRHQPTGNTLCCVPGGCGRYNCEPIHNSSDAIKVVCNNENCNESGWMHSDCFRDWEQHVLAYLRSCGRARSWSEKQRLQNLWTKKGYDLAYKACDCRCGKGHLRKDLDHIPPPKCDDRKQRKQRAKPGKMAMLTFGQQQQASPLPVGGRPQLRVRTCSFSSTGSSPPSSAGTPPLTPGALGRKNHFEFFADPVQAAAGNIFRRRTDLSAFNELPRRQQNPYHIKMEDEGPHGNDEIRCFILTNLSTHQVTVVSCVVCDCAMTVFDKYPLIDGTFFLSPQHYNSQLQVLFDHKMLYLNAVCMRCLESSRLCCASCDQRWDGSCLVIGTMYAYDIFAAMPCCVQRLSCKCCRRRLLEPGCVFNFFSEYSRALRCPYCCTEDYHFIRPLQQSFIIKCALR